jgi:hypothetical protein
MSTLDQLAEEDRLRIGNAWLEAALGEHASVAAFARFVLHIMSLGAPPNLLRAAIRAMDDEVEHARLCFAVAKRCIGTPAGPGPLDLSNVFATTDDPQSILDAAILEGCIAETISARCAEEALRRLKDESMRAPMTRIAEDESRHADLSWDFVAWMLSVHPSLKQAASACFAHALQNPAAEGHEGVQDEFAALEEFGHLCPSSRAQVADDIVRGEIRPRMEALLN